MNRLKGKSVFLVVSLWVLLGSLIGLAVGSATALLLTANDFLGETREKNGWLISLLPLGGIFIGYIYMKYGKAVYRNTLNDTALENNLVIETINGKKNVLKRMGPIVYLGTFITVLFGGSTGREGAAIQMGSSIAEVSNKLFKVSVLNKNLFIMSGVSAGFGSAFGAPITGAIFGMEMAALGKIKFQALIPCVTASFAAHYTTTAIWQFKHDELKILAVPDFTFLDFGKVIFVSILFGLLSIAYCQLRHGIQRFTEKTFKKNHMKRAFFGGIVIVLLTLMVGSQDYNGRGLEMLEQSFYEEVPPFAFLAKLLFTAVTIGSGFVGGEAIPLFFMGATLGNALQSIIDLPLSFLAALGLIATFCAGANVPLSAFLLALEMFNGVGVEFFFVACIISYLFSGHHSIWPSQQIYEPKSTLFQILSGTTIGEVEQKKKKKSE
ncbi:chloride channel protein [Bacillus sp. SCS-153A]|uniref:chloride channel protein n=1 Tax=Rossellomorea sedimentorum TaxID=3115294 RepID=UPI0039058945